MKSGKYWLLLACCALGLLGPLAAGQDLDAIKTRMTERLPTIDALRAKAIVGEDNQGYLSFLVEATKENEAVVKAENADRKVVYTAIAAKTGATPEAVGKSRAKGVASRVAKGVMVQDENGKWYACCP